MADAPLSRFAALLAKHLGEGTRAGVTSREPWTYESFADKIPSGRADAETFVSPRSVSNWRNGRSLPTKIEPILDALFGRTNQGPERANLLTAFRDARNKVAAAALKRAKPIPGGASWVAQGQTLVMERMTRRSDARAALEPLQQQLQAEIRDMASRLARATNQRPSNELLVTKVSTSAAVVGALLDCKPEQVPQ